MGKIDRIYDLVSILQSKKYSVGVKQLADLLECSVPTVKRYITKLRNEYGLPLRYDPKYNGYILDPSEDESVQFPGLWFNISELYSLLIIHELIGQLDPGLLKAELGPMRERIRKILASRDVNAEELISRIRFEDVGIRFCCPLQFKAVARATMERRRVRVRYHSRGKDKVSVRELSPQRLIYYRGNWFVVSFCHTRNGLRTLALDRISDIQFQPSACAEVEQRLLDNHFAGSFGIFSGSGAQSALLRFTKERARWVAEEKWHPDQHGKYLADGSYELTLPYSDHRELIMEILKYGPDVEVLAPVSLRTEVEGRLAAAIKKYEKK